ncbi:hypothetical protein E2C01_028570 [Portunus trituberculatus]|uniref:Uncharacterized protein n=1 Tax=Portunus trituberculatus TaxID=210409 RepID=A0A5B7EQC8_PORTR|nr:hypothetical protein [Portunus trituberculatus]
MTWLTISQSVYLDSQDTLLEDRWQEDEEEEEEVEEEEEDDFLPYNSLEEALEELDIQLPRLAVAAPPSVLPPKGVCGLRDEAFAGVEQQEAHDLLAGLLLWLHQDLASWDKLDCACTKTSLSKHLINSTARHNNFPPGYTVYTGDNHNNTNYHHHHHPSNSPSKLNDADGGRERKVCQKCGVAYQRRSFISDMFEGIHQVDVICARVGIILHTEYERFTSLSVPLTTPGEVTLERVSAYLFLCLASLLKQLPLATQEALQQHYGMDMVMWDCEYCSKSHLCHRQIRVLCSPLVLVIHLGR